MSGTTFRNEGAQFTIGEAIGRQQTDAPLVPWDELLSDDYPFHSVNFNPKMSNAYLQSWLLVHYLTLGEQMSHNKKLGRYLGLYAAGEPPESALQSVFGTNASALGRSAMQGYRRKLPYYVLDFSPGLQDHEFPKSAAQAEEITSTIDTIHRQYVGNSE